MLKKILVLLTMLYAAFAFAAVDVNKGDAAALDSVKGIGPAMSKRIVDERKKGDFKSWDDLIARVKGIGEKSAAKLSAEGLTVNGDTYKGAVAKATAKEEKKEAKAAAKEEKKDAMATAKDEKKNAMADKKNDTAKADKKEDKAMTKAEKKEEKAMAKAEKKEEKAMAKADKKEDKAMAQADKKADKAAAAASAKK